MTAEDWLKQPLSETDEKFEPFLKFIHKIHDLTGVKPQEETLLRPAETPAEYMERVQEKAYVEKGVILKALNNGDVEEGVLK